MKNEEVASRAQPSLSSGFLGGWARIEGNQRNQSSRTVENAENGQVPGYYWRNVRKTRKAPSDASRPRSERVRRRIV